jgi:glyoxylase-like metal-dependent hydrolase (beta-lactamase superfamily II)
MQQVILTVGAFEVNCLVLWEDPAQAWIVDPGADAAVIQDCLHAHGLQVGRYLCTHGHIDHVSALDALLATNPAPVWMQAADAKWAFSEVNVLPPSYPDAPCLPADLHNLRDGERLSGGGIEASVIATPGHTPGCVCLYLEREKLVLTGDTLFAGSAGRTDLPGGDWRRLTRSLAKLAALPEETQVIAGHGPATSIGEEKRANPYLQGL